MRSKDQFKDLTVEELNLNFRELSKEIYNLTNQFRITRKVEKPHLLRTKKRDRARVLTYLRQKGGSLTY